MSESQASLCIDCNPGYVAGDVGYQSCSQCPVGAYTELFGAGDCVNCPDTSTMLASSQPSSSPSDCRCSPGNELVSVGNDWEVRIIDEWWGSSEL